MKKKIIFVIDTLRMGGAEKSLISLLKSLNSDRVDVDLLVFEGGGILENEVPEWVNIIHGDVVTRGMTLELRKYWFELIKTGHFIAAYDRIRLKIRTVFRKKMVFNWKIVKKHLNKLPNQYDVAIGYLEGTSDFFVIDKIDAKKKIGWIHIDFSKRGIMPEESEYYNQFDKLVTISEICREAFIKYVPKTKNKIIILENLVLPDEIKEKAKADIEDDWEKSECAHLVSVGRLDYQKGFDIAAQAAKELKDRKVSFCWHIYGKGAMKDQIETYIEEQKIDDVFKLEGLRENPYPYVKRADIVVQPSRFEGKSIVLDEAKILGKAIVVTDYPSVSDQIKNGETGLITEISPKAIADGIEQVLNDSTLKASLEYNAENEQNSSYQTVEKMYGLIN
ncbi:MAG: glycosyltransferase [Eubacterium sp.]|nr:glycosyltransferase [Eubacterium sp.]